MTLSITPAPNPLEPQTPEEILLPGLPIIDAHHHLWDYEGRRYLFHDYLDDVRTGHNIVASVHVEGVSMYRADGPAHLKPVGETEFTVGAAAMADSGNYGPARLCAAIVAHVDLAGDHVDEAILAHEVAAGGRLRGIRDGGTWDIDQSVRRGIWSPSQGRYLDRDFRQGFARLVQHGLTFDSWLYHPQLDDLFDLASAFPDTSIVIDHAGGPMGVGAYAENRAEVMTRWRTSMARLATLPNVNVKLGGLGMWTGGLQLNREAPISSSQLAATLKPFIEPCIEMFGAGRCMFQSNFPADRGSYPYATLWNAFKRLSRECSDEERALLFHGTASRLYRI